MLQQVELVGTNLELAWIISAVLYEDYSPG